MRRSNRNNFLLIILLTGLLFSHVANLAHAETALSLGFASGQDAIVHSQKQADALGDYFSEQLSRRVKVSGFSDQAVLHRRLVQHQMVDVAWFGDAFLAGLPVGEVLPLAQLQPLANHGLSGQMVARQGADPEVVRALRTVLLSMQENATGRFLLSKLQAKRFLPGVQWVRGSARPLAAEEVSSTADLARMSSATETDAPKKRGVAQTHSGLTPTQMNAFPETKRLLPSSTTQKKSPSRRSATAQTGRARATNQKPEVVRAAAHEEVVVLGLVAGKNSLVHSETQAKALGDSFAADLSRSVKVSMFKDQADLQQWLSQYQVVDFAWFDNAYLETLPVGAVLPLAKLQSDRLQGQMVARQGLDSSLVQDLQKALLGMQDHDAGADVLSQVKGERFLPGEAWARGAVRPDDSAELSSTEAAVNSRRTAVPAEVVPPKKAVQDVDRSRSFPRRDNVASQLLAVDGQTQKSSAGSPLVLGLVVGKDDVVKSQEQAEVLGDYFAKHLSRSVKVSTFDDQATLTQWLRQHQAVDFAWFEEDSVAALPVGAVQPLAKLQSDDVRGQMVARQGLASELSLELSGILLDMQKNADGRDLLSQLHGEQFVPALPRSRGGAPLLLAVGATSPDSMAKAGPVDRSPAVVEAKQKEDAPTVPEAVLATPAVATLPVPVAAVEVQDAPSVEKVVASDQGTDGSAVSPANLERTDPVERSSENVESVQNEAAPAAPEAVLEQPAVATLPVPDAADVQDAPPVKKVADASPVVRSQQRSLAGLVGTSEISVLADADGQFVRSMAVNQVFEEDHLRQVDAAHLQESIRVGRSFNRESLAALARTEQAEAQTGQALAQLLPSVTIRANRGYETSEPSVVVDEATGELVDSDRHIRTDTALTITQPLFDLPSFLDWERRKVKEQAREEGYRVSDGDAYLSTVNAYLSLVSSRLQTEVTRDFEKQLDDLLSYIEKRSAAGAASVADVTRVRARSQSTLSSRLELESAHAAAGSEFVRLTNLVPQKVRLPVPEDIGALVLPESFDEAVAVAMKSNPEIASLSAELEAARIDELAARGRFLPTVDAEYTDTYSLHAGGAPSSDDQRDKRLMVVLNWELFSGGYDYQNRLERLARHKELRYRLDDQRRRVVRSLSANYASLATTKDRITSGYLELDSIATAADAMSKRMLSGNQSLLDLLDVYNQLYQARYNLVSLHTLEMNTMAELARLTVGAP